MTFLKVKHLTKEKLLLLLDIDGARVNISFCHAQFSEETLAVFKSYKLDDMQVSKRKMEDLRASGGEHVYFAKFLTSEKVRG